MWSRWAAERVGPNAPLAVLGPGTGLGASGLLPTSAGWYAIPGEGGHATLPAMRCAGRGDRRGSSPAVRPCLGGAGGLGAGIAEPLCGRRRARRAERRGRFACRRTSPTAPCRARMPWRARPWIISARSWDRGGQSHPHLGRARGLLHRRRHRAQGRGTSSRARAFARGSRRRGASAAISAAIPTWLVVRRTPAFLGLAHLLDHELGGSAPASERPLLLPDRAGV